jgi:HAD superfamily hydrolase (TIGR01509 family)
MRGDGRQRATGTTAVTERPGTLSSWQCAAVFFDLAGTLFSDRALRDAHLHQLRFVAAAIGVDATDQQLRAAYRRGMVESYGAMGSRPAYRHRSLFAAAFTAMARDLGGDIDESMAQEAVDRQYRATVEHATLRPDALDTLGALRQASVHVQIVSNIDDEQLHPLIDRLGLHDVVDAITSSDEALSCKPDPGIYQLALAKAGCRPTDVLFVGDSLRHAVEGPAAMGMRTAWMVDAGIDADPGDIRPDFVCHHLAEATCLVGVEVGP